MFRWEFINQQMSKQGKNFEDQIKEILQDFLFRNSVRLFNKRRRLPKSIEIRRNVFVRGLSRAQRTQQPKKANLRLKRRKFNCKAGFKIFPMTSTAEFHHTPTSYSFFR